jgi:putative ATP-dependent endonuclease of the OLD family
MKRRVCSYDTSASFSPIDGRFDEFVKRIGVSFHPDESGKSRALEELSDGQRSIFHLAMTAATLDVETDIVTGSGRGFQGDVIDIPALTLIAIEEPENSLAPFYLSRIMNQIAAIRKGPRAQAFVASHSPSILARVEPDQVRHLRLIPNRRTAVVTCISDAVR